MRSVLFTALFSAPFLFGMNPEEFKALYESPSKTADTCYLLYQAYSEGTELIKTTPMPANGFWRPTPAA